jgi:hypothetical protein
MFAREKEGRLAAKLYALSYSEGSVLHVVRVAWLSLPPSAGVRAVAERSTTDCPRSHLASLEI